MENKEVGRRIKKRREELGYSALDLAEALNFTKATVYRYENGSIKSIKLPVIEAIGEFLKVNPDWLVGKSEDKYGKDVGTISPDNDDIRDQVEHLIARLLSDDRLLYDKEVMPPDERMMLVNNLESVLELVDRKRLKQKSE